MSFTLVNRFRVLVNSSLIIALQFWSGALIAHGAATSATNERARTPLDEHGYVRIGGIDQWITIKGENRENPAILFVHGGPGNPMSLYAASLYHDWEKEFTIVHWDQRGSGRTFERNQKEGEITRALLDRTDLSFDLLARDGIEVAEHVCQTLGVHQVILTGTSWGSALAVRMVQMRPDLFRFYVGLSQVVNYQDNLKHSFELIRRRAGEMKDTNSLQLLDTLGSPPWINPRNFGKLRKISKRYEALACDTGISLVAGSDYSGQEYSSAYDAGEEFSFAKYVGLTGHGMGDDVKLDVAALSFKVPVFLLQGSEDLFTTPDVTEKYFNALKAPEKKLIFVQRCGHDPTQKMIDTQRSLIREKVSGGR